MSLHIRAVHQENHPKAIACKTGSGPSFSQDFFRKILKNLVIFRITKSDTFA